MDVRLGRPWLQPKEGVREVVAGPVELRWEVVAFRLSFATKLGGLLLVLVHMVRDGPEIIEKLAVNRPALIGIPHRFADHLGPVLPNRVLEGELVAGLDHVAESLVGGAPSLAAAVVEENQRWSIPPRCVPRA